MARAGDYQKTANDEIVLSPDDGNQDGGRQYGSDPRCRGIDGVYVGPSDLGFSYGLVPKLDREEPEILKIYDKLIKECDKRGIAPGIHCSGPAGRRQEHRWASSW